MRLSVGQKAAYGLGAVGKGYGVFLSYLHSLGHDLYYDGHTVLVDDPGSYQGSR